MIDIDLILSADQPCQVAIVKTILLQSCTDDSSHEDTPTTNKNGLVLKMHFAYTKKSGLSE